MSVVGTPEEPPVQVAQTAVSAQPLTFRRVVERVLVLPLQGARGRVYRVSILEGGEEHHAINHQRAGLESYALARVVGACGAESADVIRGDLLERGETFAAVGAVEGRPVAV